VLSEIRAEGRHTRKQRKKERRKEGKKERKKIISISPDDQEKQSNYKVPLN